MLENDLQKLHEKVDACRACHSQVCFDATARRPETASGFRTGGILLVSQAVANATQRQSGVPFFDAAGRLGATGRRLESFLNDLGATLYPRVPIALPSGAIIPAASADLEAVYNTEVIQHFPGKLDESSGDKFPQDVAEMCLDQGFVDEAIALLKPRICVLLGQKTRSTVEPRWLGGSDPSSLGSILKRQSEGTVPVPVRSIGGHQMKVVAIPHASPMAANGWNKCFAGGQVQAWLKSLVFEGRPVPARPSPRRSRPGLSR